MYFFQVRMVNLWFAPFNSPPHPLTLPHPVVMSPLGFHLLLPPTLNDQLHCIKQNVPSHWSCTRHIWVKSAWTDILPIGVTFLSTLDHNCGHFSNSKDKNNMIFGKTFSIRVRICRQKQCWKILGGHWGAGSQGLISILY